MITTRAVVESGIRIYLPVALDDRNIADQFADRSTRGFEFFRRRALRKMLEPGHDLSPAIGQAREHGDNTLGLSLRNRASLDFELAKSLSQNVRLPYRHERIGKIADLALDFLQPFLRVVSAASFRGLRLRPLDDLLDERRGQELLFDPREQSAFDGFASQPTLLCADTSAPLR